MFIHYNVYLNTDLHADNTDLLLLPAVRSIVNTLMYDMDKIFIKSNVCSCVPISSGSNCNRTFYTK